MDNCFNFESRYRTTKEVNILHFETTDGTEWALNEEWLTLKNEENCMQRLTFLKETHCDRRYFIDLEIMSTKYHASGKIKTTTNTTSPIYAIINVPLDKFKIFQYGVSGVCEIHNIMLCDRILTDDFRYKVTIKRAYAMGGNGDLHTSPRDKEVLFSNQINSLQDTLTFSDVVLLTDDYSQLRAHRNILSARSVFFRNMFTHDMSKSKDEIIPIRGMNIGILKEMLNFMYSGILRQIDVQTAFDLFRAANKYQVSQLKELCCNVMEQYVSVNNVLDILQLAHFFDEKILIRLGLNFVIEHFSQVSELDEWNRLQGEILNFVRSGVITPIYVETVQNLFNAADGGKVNEFKKQCCNVMERNMSVDNVVGILQLAHSFEEENLIRSGWDFVATHFSCQVLELNDRNNFLEEIQNLMHYGELRSIDAQTAQYLFKIADKYQVSELKYLCCYAMANYMSVDNVADILEVAYFHEEEYLKALSLKFVAENIITVSNTDAWNCLRNNNPEVFQKIISFYRALIKLIETEGENN